MSEIRIKIKNKSNISVEYLFFTLSPFESNIKNKCNMSVKYISEISKRFQVYFSLCVKYIFTIYLFSILLLREHPQIEKEFPATNIRVELHQLHDRLQPYLNPKPQQPALFPD